ncbi:MAG: hypothetical protein LIR50_05555 [Bacillota bacterium]|nr:hypothetical protein [Bacillota bacterium]
METIYTTFRCGSCKRTNIVLTKEFQDAIRKGKYLTCIYCNCSHLKNKKITNNLTECFKNDDARR